MVDIANIEYPLVTVITATYNSNPQYLSEAIQSVLSQTYPKIEYIITDDGSTQFPEEMIDELLKSGNHGNIVWKIIKNKVNVGTVRNVNGAIRASSGEYIFGMSHDDVYFDADTLSHWVGEFMKNSNAYAITSRGCMYDKDLKMCYRMSPNDSYISDIISYSPKQLYDKYWISLFYGEEFVIGGGCGIAYSKKCFEEYGLYDESFKVIEDYPYIFMLLKKNVKIYFWDHYTIKHRDGGISHSHKLSHSFCRDLNLIYMRLLKDATSDYRLFLFCLRRYLEMRVWQVINQVYYDLFIKFIDLGEYRNIMKVINIIRYNYRLLFKS